MKIELQTVQEGLSRRLDQQVSQTHLLLLLLLLLTTAAALFLAAGAG